MNAKLETVYNQIPSCSCVANCGRCCGLVMPSLAELRNIKDWCVVHHIEYKDFLDITGEGDCPYLSPEQKCLIYPVRPFLCRMLGASVDTPCPIGGGVVARVLNHSQSNALYKAIYLHGKEKPRTEKYQRLVRETFGAIVLRGESRYGL